MIKRIAFYGSAGSGKSTAAAWLFAELKKRDHNFELTSEWIKTWANEKRKLQGYDQLYVLAKQIKKEEHAMNHSGGVITDSPPLLGAVYAKYYNFISCNHILEIAKEFEKLHATKYIFLTREHSYKNIGRWETEEESFKIEQYAKDLLYKNAENDKILEATSLEHEKILNWILK